MRIVFGPWWLVAAATAWWAVDDHLKNKALNESAYMPPVIPPPVIPKERRWSLDNGLTSWTWEEMKAANPTLSLTELVNWMNVEIEEGRLMEINV